ncbi:uncharacterized protein LOC131669594 [Phymastichus coffea]|uniref:uncharacterized protein LOC131669594 n=1 Tax=Phymastichus coffea TaxID=108790 RepID=UPI00273C2848|nr:uncharacterized protein LOC131669594 [Phymastichus coffea]XP_058800566.1 uncharacterized protein LOC131669594 [Phymastichus coffea]
MRLIVLLLTSLCYDTPSFTSATAEAPKNIRAAPKRLAKIVKRQDDLSYLEQCSILQFWDKQIGRVNVLAFFDSTWPFSHRQAAMLKVLRERFDKTGFENIQFLAINAAPGESEYASKAEIEVEEETWKQISPSEAEGVPPIVPSAEALAGALGPDVYFIQDSAELQIWPKLRAFRDQILVIDRCGRLTYQVIVPWSILHFPYVKAAILSTYKDEPCGRCEFQQLFDYSTESSEETTAETWSQEAREGSATIGTPTAENGNDTSSLGRQSQLLFSQSDDYDAQTVTDDDSSTLTPAIDANETTTSSPPRENATSIAYSPTDSHSTGMQTPQLEQTDHIYGQSIVDQPVPDDYSTYTNQADNDGDALLSDESLAATDQSTPNSSTTISDYDPTTLYPRDDDHSNATQNYYEDFDRVNVTMSKIDLETAIDADNAEKLTTNVTEELLMNPVAANWSESNGERRLTEPKEIESLDARDVLKSRSTNARSVSPNDGSDNRLQLVEIKSESTSEPVKVEGQLEADYLIPIRIIMRAPHVDEYSDRSLKAHEYLVLKTGQPSYHEHLDLVHEHEHEQDRQHKAVSRQSQAVKSTFARDESPGLYGELADYWQNYGNERVHDYSTDSSSASLEDDEHEHVLEQEQSFAEDSTATVKSTTLLDDHAKALESDNEHYDDHSTSAYEDADVIDEEAKSKLIAHYSKLLPWLYYVLAK